MPMYGDEKRRMAIVVRYLGKCQATLVLTVLFYFPSISAAWQIVVGEDNQCVVCHASLTEALREPALLIKDDIHIQRGLSCHDCHGGDPAQPDKAAAKKTGTGYIGRPEHLEIPQSCNRCHGDENFMKRFNPNIRVDQYERYLTSVHGQRLLKGDQKVAVCTSCHQVHSLLSSTDLRSWIYPTNVAGTCGRCHSDEEYMEEYGIPITQVNEYHESIHYEYLAERGDLTAPTCNDCHGNHGAVPPGVQSVHYVCGTCHASNEIHFQNSSHNEYFEMLEMPGCITCHHNHKTVRVQEEGLDLSAGDYCGQCHSPDDDSGHAIQSMKAQLDSLRMGINEADSLIHLVETKGMEVSDADFQLTQTQTILTKSRNIVHRFSVQEVAESAGEGFKLLTSARQAGHSALREIRTRRIGLAISLIFITMLCIGLYLKIRQYSVSND